jgi:hypothetical protein
MAGSDEILTRFSVRSQVTPRYAEYYIHMRLAIPNKDFSDGSFNTAVI